MNTTNIDLAEIIRTELQTTLRQKYLYRQLVEVLDDQGVEVSTAKLEDLLEDVIEALAGIDMGIDYLTAAITGDDPYSINVAQRTIGRGAMVGRDVKLPSGSKPQAEVDEALVGSKTLAAHTPEDLEDTEEEEDPTALKATDVLGGEWEGEAIDDEPASMRAPRQYRREAIRILSNFNVDVGREAVDILAWELYRAAADAPTQALEEPVGKSPWWRRTLKKAIGEDLIAGLDKPLLNEISKQELSAIRHFTQGQPYEMEKMLIQLVDRYGFDLADVEQLAKELARMEPGDIQHKPDMVRYVKEELEAYLSEKKTKVSKAGQKRVSDKIAYLIDKEGKDSDQAAAIAYSMEERGEL